MLRFHFLPSCSRIRTFVTRIFLPFSNDAWKLDVFFVVHSSSPEWIFFLTLVNSRNSIAHWSIVLAFSRRDDIIDVMVSTIKFAYRSIHFLSPTTDIVRIEEAFIVFWNTIRESERKQFNYSLSLYWMIISAYTYENQIRAIGASVPKMAMRSYIGGGWGGQGNKPIIYMYV